MAARLVYVAHLVRLPLLDADGEALGRVADVVVVPPPGGDRPEVTGFVIEVHRRRIFVGAARVADLTPEGARLRGGAIDVRPFHKRPGELLARGDVIGRRVDGDVVYDVALAAAPERRGGWEIANLAVRPSRALRRRSRSRIVPWHDVASLFDVGDLGRQVAALQELHPSDVAGAIARLPLAQRRALAEAMEDERLADVLEELPEAEQVAIVEALATERAADVLEEMDPDDAVDLLSELPDPVRVALLAAMQPEEARPLRRLLEYDESTAGGLMTPEPIVVGPATTVAEALARLRDPDLPVALATQAFVTDPPFQTPTGRYRGVVGFQRLLREPPSTALADCVEAEPAPIGPDLPQQQVAAQLARYDLAAVPVCDEARRLLGAVTVDDVLDHSLPPDWRERPR